MLMLCRRLYLVTIPLLLNAATVTGFTLVSAIVGGQTLAALNPDVIVTTGAPILGALHHVTKTVPIVFTLVTDPVSDGSRKSRRALRGWL